VSALLPDPLCEQEREVDEIDLVSRSARGALRSLFLSLSLSFSLLFFFLSDYSFSSSLLFLIIRWPIFAHLSRLKTRTPRLASCARSAD
jgi:hypothetical protein